MKLLSMSLFHYCSY